MSSPSGCQAIPLGPGATRASETTVWKFELNGLMSIKLMVPDAKLLTARRRRLGDIAISTGSGRAIVSSTVIRLLFTTTTCLLSASRM